MDNYRNKLIMAPMVRIGTLPMRLLALEMGADLVYSEELIDYKLLKCRRVENRVLNTVDFVDNASELNNVVFRTCDKEKGRVILQIGTADVGRAVRAAKLVENDVAGIDVNMGCPKEFSVKGGMGVALAANLPKAKQILTALVKSVKLPVTCKIRIKKTIEETIEHVKELESTGIKAIAIHARNRDERPCHKPHPEVIKAVTESGVKIPIICNGGSKEIEKHSDIHLYKELCGASSIMIARAAEWNVSIFRKEGMIELMDIIHKYLKLAVDYDNYPSNTKYCIQNMLRELQDSELGKKFLEAQLMEHICDVFEMKDYCKQKQLEYQIKEAEILKEIKNVNGENDDQPPRKRPKIIDENTIVENIAFVRSNYVKDTELPKSILHLHLKKHMKMTPIYTIEEDGIYFRSTITIGNKKYVSTSLEKNKKYAEQCASLVACLHLNLITRQELVNNGSMKLIDS